MKLLPGIFIGMICLGFVSAFILIINNSPYFPVRGQSGGLEGVSPFAAGWYSQSLKRMKEPKLPEFARHSKRTSYRLLILPTWGNPISIRIEEGTNTYSLFSRRLDGDGGYHPGRLIEKADHTLSQTESAELLRLLGNLDFFNLPEDDGVHFCDGEMWILEGVLNGKYHVIERSSPSPSDKERNLEAFFAFCSFLVDNSRLSVRPKNLDYELLPRPNRGL